MSEETKNDKTTVSEEQTVTILSGKKANIKWAFMTVAVIVIAAIVGTVVYTSSPSYHAGEKLKLAEKYLEDMDYEQAIVNFELALEIDPNNKKVIAAIESHLEEFYQQARQYGSQEEYASEKELATFMIKVDADNVRGKIADAEADCGIGEVEKARATYEETVGGGVDEDDVVEGIQYCDAILQLLTYCEESKWEEAAVYLNTEIFDVIAERLVIGKELVYSRNVDILLGLTDNGVYVYSGELSEGSIGGRGTGIVSSVNTSAIYEGEWTDHLPTGMGVLTIWNKNEDFFQANVYEGIFAGGLLNGTTVFKPWVNDSQVEVNLQIGQGNVSVYQVDERGNVLLTENYIVEYEKAENNIIVDYIVGLPGFGGSDRTLSVKVLDVVPPVIECGLRKTKTYDWGIIEDMWYFGENPIGKRITATDDVDGDLTEQIVNESRRIADSTGYNTNAGYGLVVVYSVTDSSGNTAWLTVTYDVAACCGDWQYRLVSVN